MWRLIDAVSASASTRALVFLGTPACFGPGKVRQFWRHVLAHDDPDAALGTPHAARGEMDLHREETAHQQLAARIRECRKPVVIAMQGEVCMPSLGNALLCDYRVAADDTVFRNQTHELGLPPRGALAPLLTAYVGFAKASELLLSGCDLTAAEALDLRLVNHLAPADDLEYAALRAARRLADMPAQAFAAIKRLLTHALDGLDDHFQLENQLVESCLPSLSRDKLDGGKDA